MDKDKTLAQIEKISKYNIDIQIKIMECAKVVLDWLNKNYACDIILVGGMACVYHTKNINVATYDIDLFTYKTFKAHEGLLELGFEKRLSVYKLEVNNIPLIIEFVPDHTFYGDINDVLVDKNMKVISINDYLADVMLQLGLNPNDHQLNIRLEALLENKEKINFQKAAKSFIEQSLYIKKDKDRWNELLGNNFIIE